MSMQRKELAGITTGNHPEAADRGVWFEILRETLGRRQFDQPEVDLCVPLWEWDLRVEMKPLRD